MTYTFHILSEFHEKKGETLPERRETGLLCGHFSAEYSSIDSLLLIAALK